MKKENVNLTAQEKMFVEKRAKLAQSWPIVGSMIFIVILVFAGWLWLSNPYLINPWAVFAEINSGSIPHSTLTLMAAILPVVMITCLFILIIGLVFSFVAFSNERKHIAIIRRLNAHQGGLKEGMTEKKV